MRPCTDERFHSSPGRDVQVHDGEAILPGIVRERTNGVVNGGNHFSRARLIVEDVLLRVFEEKNGRNAPLS